MHQTAKGQQLCFGIKAQIGVDSKTKLVQTVLASAANVHDREALPYLPHGNETRVRAKVEHVFPQMPVRQWVVTFPSARDARGVASEKVAGVVRHVRYSVSVPGGIARRTDVTPWLMLASVPGWIFFNL
jgi:IS5 family transposase